MRGILLSCLSLTLTTLAAVAQVNARGTVLDREDGGPLAGASVIVKDADGKIVKFASTPSDGTFSLSIAPSAGSRLEVAMMGYAKQSMAIDSVSFPLTVYMEASAITLNEVRVKADRVREQGDTISYNVAGFARTRDRSIGDVLRRMPGIDVASDGKIQYQGEDINKFYIEGSDLLGGKYGLATNGINYDDVGAVEVLENHQPMQVLSGISFSDKAAINLKLKDKAKAVWSCTAMPEAAGRVSRKGLYGTANSSRWPPCQRSRASRHCAPIIREKTFPLQTPTSLPTDAARN